MLRITDILLRNLTWAAKAADCSVLIDSTHHIDLLVQKIQECRITFRVLP